MSAHDILSPNVSPAKRRQLAREWLRAFQREKLPIMQKEKLLSSCYLNDVTLIAYTFPLNEIDFNYIEFSVRQAWHCLGMLKTVIVADRITQAINKLVNAYPNFVEVQIEPLLIPGSITSMSHDCITKLYSRFNTPYCLIVQDDGFPIQSNLNEFVGKFDYIGSPVVRDIPLQYLVDLFRIECLNGGFSLRSKRICVDVAKQWKRYWRHLIKPGCHQHVEDVFYTSTACLNPFYHLRNHFAPCKVARRFCLPDFDGVLNIRTHEPLPFGLHGATSVFQLCERINCC